MRRGAHFKEELAGATIEKQFITFSEIFYMKTAQVAN